jgi:hypothetical protein
MLKCTNGNCGYEDEKGIAERPQSNQYGEVVYWFSICPLCKREMREVTC